MRLSRFLVYAFLCLSAVGCKQPKKAPKDLSDLTWFLYREWPDTDPQPLEDGVANLRDFLAPIAAAGHLTGDTDNRSWHPSPPTKDDLTQIPWPEGKDPSKCDGVSVAFKSVWPIEDHARWQLQTDQMLAEKANAKSYSRQLKTDPSACFADHSCLVLDTYNDILRSNITMEIQLPLFKSYRWVKLKSDGGDRWAIVARSWTDRSLNGKDPSTGIDQSASLDIWLSVSDTETWRYQAVFSETRPSYPPDVALPVLVGATDAVLQGGENAIKETFHK